LNVDTGGAGQVSLSPVEKPDLLHAPVPPVSQRPMIFFSEPGGLAPAISRRQLLTGWDEAVTVPCPFEPNARDMLMTAETLVRMLEEMMDLKLQQYAELNLKVT